MDLKVVEWGATDWIDFSLDRERWWVRVNVVMNLSVP